jgi:hypothetical protein
MLNVADAEEHTCNPLIALHCLMYNLQHIPKSMESIPRARNSLMSISKIKYFVIFTLS